MRQPLSLENVSEKLLLNDILDHPSFLWAECSVWVLSAHRTDFGGTDFLMHSVTCDPFPGNEGCGEGLKREEVDQDSTHMREALGSIPGNTGRWNLMAPTPPGASVVPPHPRPN